MNPQNLLDIMIKRNMTSSAPVASLVAEKAENDQLLELMQGYYKRPIGEGGSYEAIPFREPTFPDLETSEPVSTRVDENLVPLDPLENQRPIDGNLLSFINSSVAIDEDANISARNTPIGEALQIMQEEYGNPHIYQNPLIGQEVKIDGKWKYIAPSFKDDERDPSSPGWPRDTIQIGTGNKDHYLGEIAHVLQYMDKTPAERDSINREHEQAIDNDLVIMTSPVGKDTVDTKKRYDIPGTLEYEAHELLEPKAIKRFEGLLDSLMQPLNVDSLFR